MLPFFRFGNSFVWDAPGRSLASITPRSTSQRLRPPPTRRSRRVARDIHYRDL